MTAMIDFDGSLFVFPDKAHNKIYTKQLGLDEELHDHYLEKIKSLGMDIC